MNDVFSHEMFLLRMVMISALHKSLSVTQSRSHSVKHEP